MRDLWLCPMVELWFKFCWWRAGAPETKVEAIKKGPPIKVYLSKRTKSLFGLGMALPAFSERMLTLFFIMALLIKNWESA